VCQDHPVHRADDFYGLAREGKKAFDLSVLGKTEKVTFDFIASAHL